MLKIVELTPEEQLENEIERADEYSEKVQRSLMRIRKALRGQPSVRPTRPPDPTRPDPDPTHRDPDVTVCDPDTPPDRTRRNHEPAVRDPDPPRTDDPPAATGVAGSSKVKLPKISLPHFKGNLVYWTTFWDSYESAVHLNSG